MTGLTMTLLPGTFAVCRLAPTDDVPTWALSGAFFTVSRTEDELSVLCDSSLVPPNVRAESDWRAVKLHGPFDFGLTGVLASVLVPLANESIGIFAVSTFDTDYVLVKQAHLEPAIEALRRAGHSVLVS